MIKGQYNPKEHAKIIYEMELHESIILSSELCVTRVPGGWIYDRLLRNLGDIKSLFVPYNDEFKETEDPITAQKILKCNKITNCEIDQW